VRPDEKDEKTQWPQTHVLPRSITGTVMLSIVRPDASSPSDACVAHPHPSICYLLPLLLDEISSLALCASITHSAPLLH
jgi:hypothetical protein